MTRPVHGAHAWAGLVLYIASYDAWAILTGHETLSQAFLRGLEGWGGKVALGIVWGYITAHLWGTIPHPYDPLRWFHE